MSTRTRSASYGVLVLALASISVAYAQSGAAPTPDALRTLAPARAHASGKPTDAPSSLLMAQADASPNPLTAHAAHASQPPADAGSQDAANELSVAVGKSVLIDFAHPVTRVAVGIGDYAEAAAITPNEIMVSGKAPGETSMIVWDAQGGRQFFSVAVRANEAPVNKILEGVRRELRSELPGQSVKVTEENGSIILHGQVKDLTSSNRAVQIAQTGGKVVNLLNIDTPEAEPQILLRVRFAAIDRSKERDLGMGIASNGLANTTGAISTDQFTTASLSSSTTTSLVSSAANLVAYPIGNSQLGLSIRALEEKGLAEMLAEPNLLAANGKQASFLAGGEYPYPVASGSGTSASVSITYKEYGIRLTFIPTVTPRNTIKLQVAPEVSALDFSHTVTLYGTTVPALTTRKVNTQVELADGQTFILGGLLDNRESETFEKIPFLGSIPILGRFFQSVTRTHTNNELIVLVTPEIVTPIPAGAKLPELNYPQKFLSPNSNVPMHTPDAKSADNTLKPAPKTIPVEKLVESIKSEKPLVVEGASTSFGSASSSSGSSSTGSTTSATGP